MELNCCARWSANSTDLHFGFLLVDNIQIHTNTLQDNPTPRCCCGCGISAGHVDYDVVGDDADTACGAPTYLSQERPV